MLFLIRFVIKEINFSLEMFFFIYIMDLLRSFLKLGINFIFIVNLLRCMCRLLYFNYKGFCGCYELSVYFKDLGWDKWIIVFSKYLVYYCVGKCKNVDVNIEIINYVWI